MKKEFVLFLLIAGFPFARSVAEDMDRFLNAEMQKLKIPGLALAVVRNGNVALAKGYGMANLEHQTPVKPETIFQSGSVGKQFTAAAVMLLVEEGKVNLADPITKYFPDSPDPWRKITIRHLLTHTSGIPDYTEKQIDFRKDYTEEDLLKVLQKLPLDFAPGEKWSYSNSGYMLLGFLIHKVSGKFYGDLLQERIFRPLGMTTARIINEADIIPNRAAGYELKDGTVRNQEWVAPSLNTTADGSLYLTVLDLAKWDRALYNGQVLKKSSWQQAWTPVKLNNGTTYPYGFGWHFSYQRGHLIIEHSGHWQGFSTAISRFVDSGLTVIVMANLADVDTPRLTHLLAGLLEPQLLHPRFLPAVTEADSPSRIDSFKKALAQIADGKGTSLQTPGFAATVDKDSRDSLGKIRKEMTSTEFRGCDEVSGKGIEMLGGKIDRFCYFAVAGGGSVNHFAVAFTPDGKVTNLEVLAE